MPTVSVNILTQNRCELLKRALLSVAAQSFTDYEIILLDDGSTDNTKQLLKDLKIENLKIITHLKSQGITAGRQEALLASRGKYIAVLDDDDEWIDPGKLRKQAEYFELHPEAVLAGGGMEVKCQIPNIKYQKIRPQLDRTIRRTMLFRNNFFTSTVMFRREAALAAGGFVQRGEDAAEDYDLWLRLGNFGEFYNFRQVFARYRLPGYNKDRRMRFLLKQRELARLFGRPYPFYALARAAWAARIALYPYLRV